MSPILSPFKNNDVLGKILIILVSLLSTIGICLNLRTDSFNGNSIIYIVLFAVFIYIAGKALKTRDKNVIICSLIASLVISLIEVLGRNLDSYNNISELFISKKTILMNSIEFLGLFVLFSCLLIIMFSFLEKQSLFAQAKKDSTKFNPQKTFFLFWGIIFVAWIPYFIMYFPGILTFDSMSQIHQILGHIPMTSSHPVFHTLIVSLFVTIGNSLGNMTLGIALYSLTQMLLMSCAFAFAVLYMRRSGIPKVLWVGALLTFSLFPVHALFSMTAWKDVLFGGIMLLFTLSLMEMVTNSEKFFRNKKHLAFFLLISLGVMLLRNNGFYVFILSFPFFVWFLKGYRKKLLAIFSTCFIIYLLLMGPLCNALNIKEGMGREALSVPMQQIARVVKERGHDLTDKELEFVQNFFPKGDTTKYYTESTDDVKDYLAYIYMTLPTNNIGDFYDPRLSNAVKDHFDEDYYQAHKSEFFSSWFKMFLRFPKEYIESYLSGSFGYWYPETSQSTVAYGSSTFDPEIIQMNPFPKIRAAMERLNIYNMRNIPVISMVFSIGFNFILLFLCALIVCFKKQYKLLLVFLPIFLLMLTATASPVYAEFRYVYSFFTCLPLLIAFVLRLDTIKNTENPA